MVIKKKKKKREKKERKHRLVKNDWCQINLISFFVTVACLVNKEEAANATVLDFSNTFWHIWQEYGIDIITMG